MKHSNAVPVVLCLLLGFFLVSGHVVTKPAITVPATQTAAIHFGAVAREKPEYAVGTGTILFVGDVLLARDVEVKISEFG